MATTPPPPSTLRSPPTPKHGAGYYSYEPYATRQSTRLANQRVSRDSHTTPPPPDSSSFRIQQSGSNSSRKSKVNNSVTLSPPGSSSSSPRKKPSPSARHAISTSAMTDVADSDLSDPFDVSHSSHHHSSFNILNSTMPRASVLPTPAKTPRKKVVQEDGDVARTLFPNQTSSRTKKGRKYNGFSLESFHEDPSERSDKIEIFTDSRDRIPRVDEKAENPFHRRPKESVPRTDDDPHTSKRRKVEVKGNARSEDVREALKREDGMLYVFRGKKTFRKFNDEPDEEVDSDDLGLLAARPDLMDESMNLHVRPLTRSSIKPRALFEDFKKSQSAIQEPGMSLTDEEAATDIEEHEDEQDPVAESETDPSNLTPAVKSNITTPASPGGTNRATRSQASRQYLHQDDTPSIFPEVHKEKRISPFNGWMRKKQNPSPTGIDTKATNKRDADSIASTVTPPMKKSKGR